MFGALDPAKILMILVIALIVLGPDRLPKAARQLGSYWRTLIQLRSKLEQEFRDAVPDFKEAFPDMELPRIPKNPRAAMSNFMTGLVTPDAEPADGPSGAAAELTTGADDIDAAAAASDDQGQGQGQGQGQVHPAEDPDGPDRRISEEELASVEAALRTASTGSPTGDSATNGAALPIPEPRPEVEQRTRRDYSPFVDDVTMN